MPLARKTAAVSDLQQNGKSESVKLRLRKSPSLEDLKHSDDGRDFKVVDPAGQVDSDVDPRCDGRVLLGGEPTPLLDLRRSNPRLCVDHRWWRAWHRVHETDAGCGLLDDFETAQAVRFQHVLLKCRTDVDIRTLAACGDPLGSMLEAFFLWHDRDGLTDEIEARVLANEDREGIAKKVGVTPKVIQHFELLFFDVRSRLHVRAFASHTVLKLHRDHDAETVDQTKHLMAMAFASGDGDVVDALCGRLQSRDPAVARKVAEFFHRQARLQMAEKSATALLTLDTSDPKIGVRLLRLYVRLLRLEARRQEKVMASEMNYEQNAKAFCDGLDRSWQWYQEMVRLGGKYLPSTSAETCTNTSADGDGYVENPLAI